MPKITDLPQYTNPQDNDVKVIVDVSNNATKKITWTSIKNALKSFFDTIYSAINHNHTGVYQEKNSNLDTYSTKTPPSGDVVGTTDEQTLSNKNILTGINTQTGTSYTLVLSDAGKLVQMNNASANTLTIPKNESVAFPVGTKIAIQKYGAGNTTIQGTTGVTLRDPNNLATISTQYDMRVLLKVGTDEWVIQ